jgi:uncharacterized protein YdaU (DUF1376 family)
MRNEDTSLEEQPAFWMDTEAWMADTRHLDLEQRGAYFKLLCLSCANGLVPLKIDDAKVAKELRVSLGKWRRKIRPSMEPFFYITKHGWVPSSGHVRLGEEQ